MHASRLFIMVSLASALAACSRPQPQPDQELVRTLDLGLNAAAATRPVVSQVELGAMPEAAPSEEPRRARAVARVTRPARPSVTETAPAPQPAEVEPDATEETVAIAPALEPAAAEASAPEPQPDSEPQPTRTGRGRPEPYPGPSEGVYGGSGGGFRIPGIGGVVVIRGGRSGGYDPCAVHNTGGRGGMPNMGNGMPTVGDGRGIPNIGQGGGAVMTNPRLPTGTGQIRGGWNGGGGGGGGGRFGGR